MKPCSLSELLGYSHSGVLGASLVAVAFILPSFLMTVALSVAYYKLTKTTVGRRKLLWAIYGRRLRVRQRAGDRPFPLWRRCRAFPLAQRASVPRRREPLIVAVAGVVGLVISR